MNFDRNVYHFEIGTIARDDMDALMIICLDIKSHHCGLIQWVLFFKMTSHAKVELSHFTVSSIFVQGQACDFCHYDDLIMGAVASQITSLTSIYSTLYSDVDQRKHQSSSSLVFVRGIHRGPVNSPHRWPVTRKMFPFDDVIMVHRSLSSGQQ